MQDTIDPPLPGQLDVHGNEAAPLAPLDGVTVRGTTQLGFFTAGGKDPVSGVLKVPGCKVPLMDGMAYRKGDVLVLQMVIVVSEVAQKDKIDRSTGITMSCEQIHGGYVSDVRVIDHS